MTETTPELREHLGGSRESGVLVSKVAAGTPAENAGIGVGDLIVNVGGDEISSIADLRRALATREGETFDVEVIRDGVPTRFSVTLPAVEEDLPGAAAFVWSHHFPISRGSPRHRRRFRHRRLHLRGRSVSGRTTSSSRHFS